MVNITWKFTGNIITLKKPKRLRTLFDGEVNILYYYRQEKITKTQRQVCFFKTRFAPTLELKNKLSTPIKSKMLSGILQISDITDL